MRKVHVRYAAVAWVTLVMLGTTLAQNQFIPAPQRAYQALVNSDAVQAVSAYQLIGDSVTALAYAQTIANPSPALQKQTAELALGLRQWGVAQHALEQLIRADSDIAWAHYQLGLLLAATDKQAALSHLESARRLDEAYAQPTLTATLTDNTDTRALAYQVGTVLADLEQYPLAESAFTESAIFATSPAESLASVGLMRALQGLDYQPWVTQAQTLAPNSPEVHTLIGLAHRAAGYAFDSLTEFIIAINLAPLDPEINAQLAEAYAVLGDAHSAAFWHGQAAALSGDDPHYLDTYHAAQTALPPNSVQIPPIAP